MVRSKEVGILVGKDNSPVSILRVSSVVVLGWPVTIHGALFWQGFNWSNRVEVSHVCQAGAVIVKHAEMKGPIDLEELGVSEASTRHLMNALET